MRSLQECQAEVFRRSERKIKQRRKRIRRSAGILLACVPLCLCLALLPRGSNNAEMKESVQYGAVQENSLADSELSVSSIKIYADKGSYTLTDEGDILYLMSLIEQHPKYGFTADAGTVEPEDAPETEPMQPETMAPDEDRGLGCAEESPGSYTITLVMTDGSIRMYTVTENKIIGLQTDELAVLTDGQIAELLAFLAEKAESK